MANFCHFGKTFKVFGNILRVYLVFSILLNLLWQIWSGIGQIFIAVNGGILKNNLAIWSHCCLPPVLECTPPLLDVIDFGLWQVLELPVQLLDS